MKYQAVRGTHDILPGEVEAWQRVEESARRVLARFGFREIRTPIFEVTDLFARGVGSSTDIVRKEMFTLESGDDSITLRPEATAPVVRAFIEHGLSRVAGVDRLYYIGPMFRRERPQKGRQRQFHQLGVEAIGSEDPYIDAETIDMVIAFLGEVLVPGSAPAAGVPPGLELLLNSVGCAACRPAYRELLLRWLDAPAEGHGSATRVSRLCADCRRRLVENPLRVFDCKVPEDKRLLSEAPLLIDHLCAACRDHFETVERLLDTLGIAFKIEPRLVRGLDYYVRTAFEIVASEGLGAQNALMGGGRYDGLMKELGGPDLPGFGWALGLERLMLLLEGDGGSESAPGSGARCDLFVAHLGEGAFQLAVPLARDLRRAGLSVRLDARTRGLAAQLKRADREGARFGLILGDDEIRSRTYQLRDMAAQTQEPFPEGDAATLPARLAARIGLGRKP